MAVTYKDYYEILGVSRSASQDAVRKAYRKLAKKHHPDVSKDKDADVRYKEINEAYEVPKDPDKRARYDALGPNWEQGQDFSPPRRGGPGGSRVGSDGDWGNFSDFFKTLFGSDGGIGDLFAGRGGARSVRRDAEVELQLSLEELMGQEKRTLTLRRADGVEETVHFKLPRGAIEGSRIRLPGKALGGGDLYVTLRLGRHADFEVKGHDLLRVLRIAPWQAALGTAVDVATLDGKVCMKILPGTQGGQRLRLKGKGLPKRAAGESGDLYVRVEIAIPVELTENQKKLWEQLATA